MTRKPYAELAPASRRRLVAASLLRAAGSVSALLVVYYLIPLDRPIGITGWIVFGLGLVAFAVVIAWQVRAIMASHVPRLRAVQGAATGFAVLLLLFAAIHLRVSVESPESFTEPLNRTGSLYYTLTVFATVGFGDIAPRTDLARIITMIQMVMGLVAVGLVARILLSAAQTAASRLERDSHTENVSSGNDSSKNDSGVTPNG